MNDHKQWSEDKEHKAYSGSQCDFASSVSKKEVDVCEDMQEEHPGVDSSKSSLESLDPGQRK